MLVIFTDGDDTSSKVRMGTVMDRARAEEVMVYAIGLESTYGPRQQIVRTRPDGGLKKIADETGDVGANPWEPFGARLRPSVDAWYRVGLAGAKHRLS